MRVLKYNDMIKENKEESFSEKMESDLHYKNIVHSAIKSYLSSHDIPKFESDDDITSYFYDICFTKEFLDETDLPSDFNELHSLCCYTTADDKIESTWDNLLNVMSEVALSNLRDIATVHSNRFSDKLIIFLENNNLDINNINISENDPHGSSRPSSVKNIDNGSIYMYRKLDGDYDVDVYEFNYDDINLYIWNR